MFRSVCRVFPETSMTTLLIDLPDLRRITLQQARSRAAIPMRYEPGIFGRLGKERQPF